MDIENELGKQSISSVLVNTRILLFKAMLKGILNETDNIRKLYKYISTLEYNNVNQIIEKKSNITLIKVSNADHGNILKQEKLLVSEIRKHKATKPIRQFKLAA